MGLYLMWLVGLVADALGPDLTEEIIGGTTAEMGGFPTVGG